MKTNYDLFRFRPIRRRRSKGVFVQDESDAFWEWVAQQKANGPKKAVILGNAPCLRELSKGAFEALSGADTLTIGLNRSIYLFQTDVLLWCDLLTINEILKKQAIASDNTMVLHARPERDHRLPVRFDKGLQQLPQYWSAHKNFREWNKSKLFMFRNGLTAALHLCYLLGIKDVSMVGFGFDNRKYFYETDKFTPDDEYELLDKEDLQQVFGGYDTQKIVREVIEYLVEEEGMRITYNGDSSFLKTVNGIEQITL